MAQGVGKPKKSPRPERIRVPNRERVLLTVDGHKFVAILQRLSLTGGSLIHTEQPFPNATLARLDLRTVFGKVTAQIELLHTSADGITAAQAFRFLSMDSRCTSRLRTAIEKMRIAGFSDVEAEEKAFAKLFSERLSTLKERMDRVGILGLLRKKLRDKS